MKPSTRGAIMNALIFFYFVLLLAFAPMLIFGIAQRDADHERLAKVAARQQPMDQAMTAAKRGASPVVQDVLDQLWACEQQEVSVYKGDRVWGDARRVLWIPCVEQGDGLLQAEHAEASTEDFHRRLAPMEPLAQRLFEAPREPLMQRLLEVF